MSIHSRLLPGSGFARLLILSIVLPAAAPAAADSMSVTFDEPLPSYTVIGNGEAYTHVQGAVESVGYLMSLDAGSVGGVKKYHSTHGATASKGDFVHGFEMEGGYTQPEFFVPRPSEHSTHWAYTTTEEDLVDACNAYADMLRGQGYGDTYIFSQDRVLDVHVAVSLYGDFTVNMGFDPAPVIAGATMKLTCKQWAGTTFEPPVGGLAATPGVSDIDYSLQEIYGISGACLVKLTTTVTTTQPNMKLRFRYEHSDGKLSEIYTEYSDGNKKAELYHQFDIPNGPGLENGAIRMIGVSPEFDSQWENYALDCTDPGPQKLKLNVKPTVSMDTEGVDKTMIGGEACPTRLKLTGTIKGPGGDDAASGKAIFFGPGFLSSMQDYAVEGSQVKKIVAHRDLQWDMQPALTLGGGMQSSESRSQTVKLGFNITGGNDNVIASVPLHDITVSCNRPQVLPSGGGNVTTLPGAGTPTAPAPVAPSLKLKAPEKKGVAPLQPLPMQTPAASRSSTPALKLKPVPGATKQKAISPRMRSMDETGSERGSDERR